MKRVDPDQRGHIAEACDAQRGVVVKPEVTFFDVFTLVVSQVFILSRWFRIRWGWGGDEGKKAKNGDVDGEG